MTSNKLHHVAIIMDGNRRWAEERGLSNLDGLQKGCDNIGKVVEMVFSQGITHLTLFAFSTENWAREQSEVSFLMNMVNTVGSKQLEQFKKNGVKIVHLGSREGLEPDVIELIDRSEEATKGNTERVLCMALNYGGRQDILHAARRLIEQKVPASEVNQELFSENLMTAGIPDPELLIRTGGEMRVSNFLLWQLHYAEIYCTDTYWPEFGKSDFALALESFKNRRRRFGR